MRQSGESEDDSSGRERHRLYGEREDFYFSVVFCVSVDPIDYENETLQPRWWW